jgi:ABC-type multidrug transport system ATPase subunit
MATTVLEISDLTKRYGKLTALAGLDLTLHDGTVHGLVGPNGAGKTTMLSVISGLRRKTSGEIIFGVPTNKVMLMPDTPDFFHFSLLGKLWTWLVIPLEKKLVKNQLRR